MLSYFKIRNFKSILDVTVDFSYDEIIGSGSSLMTTSYTV